MLSEFEVLGRVTRTLLDSGEVDTTVLAASLGFYTDVDPQRIDEDAAAHHLGGAGR